MKGVKKKYTADELLQYAHKYNQIPVLLFAKDTDGTVIYTSNTEECTNTNKEKIVLEETDADTGKASRSEKTHDELDKEIMRTGKGCHYYSEQIQNGKKTYTEIAKNPVYADGKIIGVCGVASDVTELMQLKKKFEMLTMYDNLTGLYNRNYVLQYNFNDLSYMPCSYIMCDCNDLKKVNDQMGHNEGDKYLKETAGLLQSVMPSEGICIRWGGDEFLMIIPGCDEYECEKLMKVLGEKQKERRKKQPYFNLAAGGYVRHDVGQSETKAIQFADLEMYEDKKKRKVSTWK